MFSIMYICINEASIKMKIINIMGTLAGFAALVLSVIVLAEAPTELETKDEIIPSLVCKFNKLSDQPSSVVCSITSTKEKKYVEITTTVHGQTTTTSTTGTNLIMSSTSTGS